MIVKGPSCENKNTFGGYKIEIKDLRYSIELIGGSIYPNKLCKSLFMFQSILYYTDIGKN